jgi:hypothetical protein
MALERAERPKAKALEKGAHLRMIDVAARELGQSRLSWRCRIG